MKMNIEIILSSAVITTILSGVISFGISRKEGKLHSITGERRDWREKIRNISCKLDGANYKEILKILTELKVRINAFGNRENIVNYNSDAHIWYVINEIEKGGLDTRYLQVKQKQLIEYLSPIFEWGPQGKG